MAAAYTEHRFDTPALRRLARPAWTISYDDGDDALEGVIAPDAQVEIVFQLGDPCAISRAGTVEPSPRAMVYGLRHSTVQLNPRGANAMVGFRLPPVVGAIVLGAPLVDCWDRPIPLFELIGDAADDLMGRIFDRPIEAASVIESWLQSRLTDWDADHGREMRVHDQLLWEFGDEPVSALADSLGISERTLRRRCEAYAGLSPKQIVMSGRMLRACDLLRGSGASPAEVAYRLGFTDQAAFANAFRRYLGMTPGQLRALPLVHYEQRRGR